MAAERRPLYGVSLQDDDHERLAVIALLRGRRDRTITKSDVVAEIVRAWLAGPGQRELAEAADNLAGPRMHDAG